MLTLALLFFIVALLYSSVGFGGGSSYIALLAAFGISFAHIPKVSLVCNILVVSGGVYHYWRANLIDGKLVYPLVISSIPFAFIGGSFKISKELFFILLSLSLCFVGIRILFLKVKALHEVQPPNIIFSLIIGSLLGLLSGMVGIGGGIFLSPLIIYKGWATSKTAASAACVFIFLNSISGLMGQLTKGFDISSLSEFYLLYFAVIVGGQVGSRLGTHPNISYKLIQRATGLLTLIISLRIFFKNII